MLFEDDDEAEFGTGGAATDGEPNGEEGLSQRAKDELAAKRAKKGADGSVKERAANGGAEPEEEADGQFAFEVPGASKKITLGTAIPRGTPTELKYKMSGKSVPNHKGGLIDPSDTTGLLLVSYIVEDIQVKFTRDSNHKIEKATIYVVLAPRHIVNARSEAGETLLAGEPGPAAAAEG